MDILSKSYVRVNTIIGVLKHLKNFKYHNGNSKPQGFGHIGFSVPNVYEASNRFEKLGVKFVKKPDDGKMKGLAFIEDPDGYWIEILQADMIIKKLLN